MKKFLLACSVIGAISASGAYADQARGMGDGEMCHMMKHEHGMDPAEHAAHLQKTLQLSDDQTAKVKKILEDSEQQGKALADKYKPQFEAFHDDMKKLHDQAHSQISAILTPKQQQAMEEQIKTRDKMMHHRDDKGDEAKR